MAPRRKNDKAPPWPKTHDGAWAPYMMGENFRIYGRPRCPKANTFGKSNILVVNGGATASPKYDHYIGMAPATCSVCHEFKTENKDRSLTPYNFGWAWQWIKRRDWVSAKYTPSANDLISDPGQEAVDAMAKMAEAAQNANAEFARMAEVMDVGGAAIIEEDRRRKRAEPEPKIPLLVQRRWAEERKAKKRRHAG